MMLRPLSEARKEQACEQAIAACHVAEKNLQAMIATQPGQTARA
jgi:hypothetical protein